MDESSTASSFYEPPVRYDEVKTRMLYERVKKDLREARDTFRTVQKNMLYLQKEAMLTVKLIDKLQSAEKENDNESQSES